MKTQLIVDIFEMHIFYRGVVNKVRGGGGIVNKIPLCSPKSLGEKKETVRLMQSIPLYEKILRHPLKPVFDTQVSRFSSKLIS